MPSQRDAPRTRRSNEFDSPVKLRSLEEQQTHLPVPSQRNTLFRGTRRVYLGLAFIAITLLILLNIPNHKGMMRSSLNEQQPDSNLQDFHNHGSIDETADRGLFESEGHHTLFVLVNSTMSEISRRMLIRKHLFDNYDNLVPCRRYNTEVHYKFLVRKEQKITPELRRQYVAEKIEYDDIVELPGSRQQDFLEWARSLTTESDNTFNFDYLLIMDEHAVVRVDRVLDELKKKIIGGGNFKSTSIDLHNPKLLVWGGFDNKGNDDKFVVMGMDAISMLLDSKDTIGNQGPNIITSAYNHFAENPDGSPFLFVEDDQRIIPWTNQIGAVQGDEIAVFNAFIDDEFHALMGKMNIHPVNVCSRVPAQDANSPKKPNIVVLTSSFVYPDNCMLTAADIAADNKRKYAKKHGYAFVARSKEFAEQIFLKRKTVWGKVDAVEKVLVNYDWMLWLDMDAVIFNPTVTVEGLLEKFKDMTDNLDNKHLIVAKPRGDSMINAGVFLIRNSEWSRKYLRAVQEQTTDYFGKFYEQHAMWVVMQQDEWKEGALLLDGDDHTFNTFPNRYKPGDFVVHYAPDACPAKQVIDGVQMADRLEEEGELANSTS
ncbi:uncharacterized protein VTP21DRAFT_442 [Calcarisporiella thermophila]|uniref:uncharacterized protein n=1 Tax=Calcarisporiella thermophila TaxID=911321 RepID=UPI003744A235